ncbi:MAG: site-2 protease family protein [Candidatus Gracilibacteria bacterium]|nr:site-2 protease family protein [Candidatus Gracilibacteria bacterium]
MEIIFGIIVALLIFTVVVLIHEFGHFTSARKFGVKVYEFGLGIPPKAKKLFTDKKGTEYTLNWVPLGGFVKMAGENLAFFDLYNEKGEKLSDEEIENKIRNNEDIYDKRGEKIPVSDKKEIKKIIEENKSGESLVNKTFYAQATVILAGVFMNFVLAILIFSGLFMAGVKPIGINTKIPTDLDVKMIPTFEQAKKDGLIIEKPGVFLSPLETGPAVDAGIKLGDIVTKIGDKNINNYEDFTNVINNNPNKQLTFFLDRPNPDYKPGCECIKSEPIELKVTINTEGKINSYISPNVEFDENFEYKYGPIEALKMGTKETYNQSLLTFEALGSLVRKLVSPENEEERQEALKSVSGPIGVVNLVSKTLSQGAVFMIILMAIISINLGVFNLLPIPALDGGRFLFMTIDAIGKKLFKRKIVNAKFEMITHLFFFFALILLGVLIAYKDIMQIIGS